MSLFKKHKSFEQQLKQQLADAEFKPTDSLWNQIDGRLVEDTFEHGIRAKVEPFEMIPNPQTWNKIDQSLQTAARKRKRIGFFIGGSTALLLAIMAFGVWYTPTQPFNQNKQIAVNTQPIKSLPETLTNTNDLKVNELQQTEKNIGNSPSASENSNQVKRTARTNLINDVPKQTLGAKKVVKRKTQQSNEAPSTPESTVANKATNQSKLISAQPKNNAPQVVAKSQNPIVPNHSDSNRNQETNVLVLANGASIDSTQERTIIEQPSIITNQVIATDTSKTTTNVKVRELTGSDTSIASIQQSNEATATEPTDDLTRFSISIYAGAHYSFSSYAKPQSSQLNFEENIAFRKQLERPAIDWAGGFLVDYRINDRWMISSGFMLVQFTQKVSFDTTKAFVPANPVEVGAPVSNPNDSFIFGNRYSDRIRYSWTEIPIWFNYTAYKSNRWNADIQFGVGYAFIGTIDAGIVSYDNKGILIAQDKLAFPQIRNTVFATVMPQISYRFGQQVSIGVAPSFKYGMQSIIGNSNWVQQHPYFGGLSVCLRKRF